MTMWTLIIVFSVASGGGAIEKQTAGPYLAISACEKARDDFIKSVRPSGTGIVVNAGCLEMPTIDIPGLRKPGAKN